MLYLFVIENDFSTSKLYGLKKCAGSGCPYTASWLAHINLYRKLSWWLHSTKMEEATFKAFTAPYKYQLEDPHAYFVHHLSEYEHALHKSHGFDLARNRTEILSYAAYEGECANVKISSETSIIAFIPFYGGLPPNVTSTMKVRSIGQGNSLVINIQE